PESSEAPAEQPAATSEAASEAPASVAPVATSEAVSEAPAVSEVPAEQLAAASEAPESSEVPAEQLAAASEAPESSEVPAEQPAAAPESSEAPAEQPAATSEAAPATSEAPAEQLAATSEAASTPNTYPVGQCTWGAKSLAPWAGNNWGNAKDWIASAQAAGHSVGTTPVAGAIAVWPNDGGGYGHVAYVTSASGANSIQVMESNYAGNMSISNYRGTFDPTSSAHGGSVFYIYP
ncbi:MAG: CHAP domain-containing protein, partial [Streptococcus thermophilus]